VALLRLAAAAERVGVHPVTLRRWADEGQVAFCWVGQIRPERRFDEADLDALAGVETVARVRVEVFYVRVSGSSGQESSLAAQEQELRRTSTTTVGGVFKDRASGLRERRPGLDKLLKQAAEGRFTVVRVTHGDRLARFGSVWIERLLAVYGVSVEVLHPKGSAGGMDELLDDFMSLVVTFAGRMYGIRSEQARRRLLEQAVSRSEGQDADG
jgi:predicted site-specific integrase-resolvase